MESVDSQISLITFPDGPIISFILSTLTLIILILGAFSARVSLDNDTIGFSTFHKFRHSEKVIYKTDGQTGILGLSTESYYYVETIDASTIKLYKNVGFIRSIFE